MDKCGDEFKKICMECTSDNVYDIVKTLFEVPIVRMHGPEHHFLVGFALLTAYKNAGGDIDLEKAIDLHRKRNRIVPAAFCGDNGSCGSAISAGTAYSIIWDSNVLCKESWGDSQLVTSDCLRGFGIYGGPRCCKRDCTISAITGARYINESKGVDIKYPDPKTIKCTYMKYNPNCIGARCPFSPGNQSKEVTSENKPRFQ